MSNLQDILKSIKKEFSERKTVDFDKEDIHIEIEPLTSKEEVIVLESVKDVEDAEYLEALKRYTMACSIKKINDMDLDVDDVEVEEGKTKSKFLFMVDYLADWPSGLIDLLFDAFTNMQKNVEDKIKKSAKYERYNFADVVEDEETKNTFKKLVENTTEGMDEMEKLKKKVEEEEINVEAGMMNAEQAAKK